MKFSQAFSEGGAFPVSDQIRIDVRGSHSSKTATSGAADSVEIEGN
jgi:hypothetical protein